MAAESSRGSPLSAKQIAAAREYLRGELRRHSHWPDLWNLRGLLEAWEGHLDRARSSFARATALNPSYGTARWNLQWIGLLEGRAPTSGESVELDAGENTPVQSRELLGIIRNRSAGVPVGGDWRPPNPSLAFAGMAMAATGRERDALSRAFEWLRAILPEGEELVRDAGLTRRDGSLHRKGLAELGIPERLNPDHSALLRLSGRLEERRGRDREARRLLALAALLLGDPALFQVEWAVTESRRGRGEEAERLLRRAADLRPDWYRPHLLLGYELSAQGLPAKALPCLERAAALCPRYPDVLYQLGLVQHAVDRNADAMRSFESALECNPAFLVARIALANLLFDAGRADEAAPHYEQIFDEGMTTPHLAGCFGYSMHAAGSRNRAEEIFLEALSGDPDRAEVLTLYGQFLAETDRSTEARAVWTRALDTGPSEELGRRIRRWLGQVSVKE